MCYFDKYFGICQAYLFDPFWVLVLVIVDDGDDSRPATVLATVVETVLYNTRTRRQRRRLCPTEVSSSFCAPNFCDRYSLVFVTYLLTSSVV